MRTEIIYEDKDILVIYKPAGLATQTAKLGQADVLSELKNYLMQSAKGSGKASQVPGREVYLGVIHRLDQPVEGLLVFAKQKRAAADLTKQLQSQGEGGSLHKHYYAVVCGNPEAKQGRLVDYMLKSAENLAVIVDKSANGQKQDQGKIQAREAVLEYQLKAGREVGKGISSADDSRRDEQNVALIDINIFTGRFHQIRAQMAHAGIPLLGDTKYGSAESKELTKALGIQAVALCAYSLEFLHPTTKKRMYFEEKPRGKAFEMFS